MYRSDIKKSWNELSLLLGRKSTRTPIKDIISDGITTSDDIQIPEAMSDYFSSISETLDNDSANIPS